MAPGPVPSSLRINRFLAQAGLGSRRGVEALVASGRVRINGEVVRDLGHRVDPRADRVEVEGREVRANFAQRLILLHKPVGVVCTLRAQDARPTLRDVLGDEFAQGRLFHVGRLDHDSSGLLLLSDDGDLAQALLHPRRPVWKTYRIEIDPPRPEPALAAIRDGGIDIDGRPSAPARLRALDSAGRLHQVQLREGRKRQLRRMVEALGSRVIRLERIAFGPLELGGLPPGRWRDASAAEIEALRAAAGLDDASGNARGPARGPGVDGTRGPA